MKKLFVVFLSLIAVAACDKPQTETDTAVSAPTESAEEFVARVNVEFKEYWRELNAAGWLRATYINEDSGIVDALANQRYAAWHTAKVKEAMQYDDVEPAVHSTHSSLAP